MNDKKPRYKHKLNMLEPGTNLLKLIGFMLFIGGILYITKIRMISYVLFSISVILLILLFILLIIEQHQDKMLYLDAKKENPEIR